ncbi:MAG: glutamate/gamma-aminobutyrate family transporter YjeM [Sarcina sp.]
MQDSSKEIILEEDKKYKISFMSFVGIIFLTVYGLQNAQQIYYQMGYASITYVVIAAIVYFIPYSFIVAEMSSAFKHKSGGIYSWMSEAVGERFSLIGTFIWYGAFVVLWFSATAITVNISVALFGKDTTASWHFLGFNSPETIAIIGAAYMIIVGFMSTRGLKRMTFLSNISIVTVIISHILIMGGGLLVFALSGFKFAQGFDPSHIQNYFYGPNPSYSSVLPAIAFMVFTIFVFAGMENSAGLVDKVKNAKKNVPKAIILSTVIIMVLYIAIIIITGMVCNWNDTFGSGKVNLANYTIYITQQQFYRLGTEFGMSPNNAIQLGMWVNRVLNILVLIGFTSMPLRIYSPIKHLLEGLPKGVLPEKITKSNKHGLPSAMIAIQTVIVVAFMLLLGFGGNSVSSLFNKITLMSFVAGTVPISFIVFAYIKFKRNDSIKKEYVFFNKTWGIIVGIICFVAVTFTNVFSIIQPGLSGSWSNTFWVAMGPVLFGAIGLILHIRYTRRKRKGEI